MSCASVVLVGACSNGRAPKGGRDSLGEEKRRRAETFSEVGRSTENARRKPKRCASFRATHRCRSYRVRAARCDGNRVARLLEAQVEERSQMACRFGVVFRRNHRIQCERVSSTANRTRAVRPWVSVCCHRRRRFGRYCHPDRRGGGDATSVVRGGTPRDRHSPLGSIHDARRRRYGVPCNLRVFARTPAASIRPRPLASRHQRLDVGAHQGVGRG